jgi:hypothetical protein
MLRSIKLPELHKLRASSEKVEQLLDEAARRIDHFLQRPKTTANFCFVSSDFRGVDSHLHWILERQLTPGMAFCEWGSGYGVVTMLAALHQFDACGIEVQADLVERSRELAADFDIAAQFVCGSLIPEGGEEMVNYLEDLAYINTHAPNAYDELELDVDDFDLFYTFPWPGEERFCELLFDHYAASGALLLSYHGVEGFRLKRKVSR